MLSVNYLAYYKLQRLIENSERYGLKVLESKVGATIVDAGVESKGGYQAGRLITEICLGGLGRASLQLKSYGELSLPMISVQTDHPVIATLGSQFAGWNLKCGSYRAMGSGPARALALKPKRIFEKIGYVDDAEVGVLFLEAGKLPPDSLIEKLTEDCRVDVENMYFIVAPTSSIAGSIQISGRVVETGIHRLSELGLDLNSIIYALGSAPIAPIHPDDVVSMGRTNDSILYGGTVYLTLRFDDEEELENIVNAAPSSASEDYGRPFLKVFEEADYDFYKIDPKLFAPSTIIVNNLKTGRVIRSGNVDVEVILESYGLIQR